MTDLKTRLGNDIGLTDVILQLIGSKQPDKMESDPPLDMNYDQDDPDLTPTAAHPQILWAQGSGVSLVADSHAEILQRRSF